MSFTSTVKNEVSKLEISEIDSITELSSIIRNSGIIDNNIKITTENASVARRIFVLIKNLFNYASKITVRRGFNFNKNYISIVALTHEIEKIKKELSLDNIPQEFI